MEYVLSVIVPNCYLHSVITLWTVGPKDVELSLVITIVRRYKRIEPSGMNCQPGCVGKFAPRMIMNTLLLFRNFHYNGVNVEGY